MGQTRSPSELCAICGKLLPDPPGETAVMMLLDGKTVHVVCVGYDRLIGNRGEIRSESSVKEAESGERK